MAFGTYPEGTLPDKWKRFPTFTRHLNGAIDYFDHVREGGLDWHNDWETCYDKGYSTELITQEAVRCINTYKKEGPFLLYVAYNAPHTPLQAQRKRYSTLL
ncbi:sulfatase-like hydrolase/transferase [Bacteroides thetaiotaomicron]|nr:sulfatase-like hydrolase/transferase [Bacteroides thetaiotaomicron]